MAWFVGILPEFVYAIQDYTVRLGDSYIFCIIYFAISISYDKRQELQYNCTVLTSITKGYFHKLTDSVHARKLESITA